METVDIRYTGPGERYQSYSVQDLSLINTALINATFGTGNDYIEFFIKDLNGEVLSSNYNDTTYRTSNIVDPTTGTFSQLILNPEEDAAQLGYDRGIFNVKYNFLTTHLLSNATPAQNFWIKQISPSRTEIKAARQDLSNSQLADTFNAFNAVLTVDAYYPTFYLNFGQDNLVIGVNAVYVEENGVGYVIFKLYEPLPENYDLKSQFWVVTQAANSAEYNVSINIAAEAISDTQRIKGPNFDVKINDSVGQNTPYYSYTSLFSTALTSSYQQIQSIMQDKGILINTDYSSLENFIHFSSATERLYNFVYKLQLIESASLGLTQTNTTQARISLQAQIDSTITNFDGWEYYMYYTSESTAWPKQNSTTPYTLYSVTSSQAENWLGSINTTPTATTMSMYWSASYYDNNNKDWLLYATPDYIAEDSQNAPYLTFLNMIGQHFDNIWIYYKDVTNRYSAENNPFVGISMDQVANALRSFGIQLYTNTSIADSVYSSLLGLNQTGSNLPVTSSNYATVIQSSSSIYPLPGNDWLSASLFLPPFGEEKINQYVISFISGSPTTSSFQTLPESQLTGEIYKRIYHNLPYLLKTRGTERGVKALIATYGIPADIMPVHEYGGYNYLEVPGIQEISNVRIITGSVAQISSSLLNPYATLQYYSNDLQNTSITVQAGFSPADSINAAITSSGYVTSSTQPGYFNIMQLIGNPALQYTETYTPLEEVSNTFFTNTFPNRNNVWDFIRIIKYYNNSLFKMLRDWVPARSSADTGIVIKSHMLERNKYPRKEPTWSTSSYTASIEMLTISGSDGGAVIGSTNFVQVVPIQYNGTASANFTASSGYVEVSQSYNWPSYTGEFDGTTIVATTNYFPQEEVSSYIFPWTSSIPGGNVLFLTYSLNALYQNVNIPVRSQRFYDLDYNANQIAPTNYGLITQSMQETLIIGNVSQSEQLYSQYAFIQDFNYFSRPYIIPRYSGSYLSGQAYNEYTSGDTSYGNDPVINWYSQRLGLFTQVASSSFLPGKVNVSLAYFADVSGGLFELNQNNRNWVDVQNTFKAGTTLTIKQFDNKKYSNQVGTDGIKTIYNSGYNYTPQLYFITGADEKIYFEYAGTSIATPFTGYNLGSPNAFISGASSPNYAVTITDPTLRTGNVYKVFDGENPATPEFTPGSSTNWASYTASQAGQVSFTVDFDVNFQFQSVNSGSFSWGAYKDGSTLIGSVQTAEFTASVTGTTYSTGSVNLLAGRIVDTSAGATVVVTNVTTIYGPLNFSSSGTPVATNIGTPSDSIRVDLIRSGSAYVLASPTSNISAVFTPYVQGYPSSFTSIYSGTPVGSTTVPGNTVLTSTKSINYTTPPYSLASGDTVLFKFIQESMSTSNYTASVSTGTSNSSLTAELGSQAQGVYPYATSSLGNFIYNIYNPDTLKSTIVLSEDLTNYYGYQFVPAFVSASVAYTSSLYPIYGDINTSFSPQQNDKIVLYDNSNTYQDVDVLTAYVSASRTYIEVVPQVLDNWVINPSLVRKFLLLRRYNDEQNVILTFNKNFGQTSYGFIIPNTISPQVVDNINTLQASVQSQILVQQTAPPIDTISGGTFE